uniref:Cuticle protein n=1 Tax=Daphnia magna TaxID=35525 RepID=A0A0P5S2Z4_9CRUS
MKILAFIIVVVAASVSGDAQQRSQRPPIRIYHPEFKIPIARPYSAIKRETPVNPVVITPSASRQLNIAKEEIKEEFKPEIARPVVRQVAKPAVKEEMKAEVKNEARPEDSLKIKAVRSIGNQKNPRSYSFGYVIKDQETFNDFEQQEKRDGDVVTGSYRVNLPDGRVQLVNYRSAPETGNIMQVSYEGEAKYPDYVPTTEMMDNKGKRTIVSASNKAAKANQVIKINQEIIKINQEVKSNQQIKVDQDVRTNADKEIKAVYTRPSPAPPTPKAVVLPVKYSAQYKTAPRAPTRARSVEPFVPSEPLPTPEKLAAESLSAPSESLLRIISKSLPKPEKFSAPVRARIVEFPAVAPTPEEAVLEEDFNDVLEFDGPLPIPAAYRNGRRIGNRANIRKQVERWW